MRLKSSHRARKSQTSPNTTPESAPPAPTRHDTHPLRRFISHRSIHTLEAVKASAQAHEQELIEQASLQNGDTGKSDYLGNLVYGGLDGIITTFAVVSGVVDAQLSPEIILILGLSNLLADGFSMATGAYISAKSEAEVYSQERHHISQQIVNAPQEEIAWLVDCYRRQGYSEEDARQLTEIQSRDPGRWVSRLMAEKLLLVPKKRKPLVEGLATLGAFVMAGSLPLAVYFTDLIFGFGLSTNAAFLISIALSGAALFGLGAAKVFVTKRSAWRSGFEMLLVGSLASLVAFGVGTWLKNLVGTSSL